MKCIEVEENLDALIDGEIGFSEKEKIECHLESCDSCQTELASLQSIGETMKKTLPTVAPISLDAKVFEAFDNHYAEKQTVETSKGKTKVGWFGIPKIAFATAFILLTLFSGLAFQLGRMSVDITIVSQAVNIKDTKEKFSDEKPDTKPIEEFASINNDETKIVEVPVIKEKIVKVPVIKEKIVTRIVYRSRIKRRETLEKNSTSDFEKASKPEISNYQIVSELKPQIIRTGENNEK